MTVGCLKLKSEVIHWEKDTIVNKWLYFMFFSPQIKLCFLSTCSDFDHTFCYFHICAGLCNIRSLIFLRMVIWMTP